MVTTVRAMPIQHGEARPWGSRADIAMLAMLLIALVVRLAWLIGPLGSDDANYFHFAQLLLHGEPFTQHHHHGGRLAFLVAVGLPAAWAGSVFAGAVVCVLILSLRDALFALYVRQRFSETAAASAVGVVSFNGVSAVAAGAMLPDGLLSLLMFASAALAFEGIRRQGMSRSVALLVGGLLAGAAYSAKDTGILIVPCVLVLLVHAAFRSGPRWLARAARDVAPFAVGLAVFVLLEMLAYAVLSGDPLYRLHAIAMTHNTNGDVAAAPDLLAFIKRVYWNVALVVSASACALPLLIAGLIAWSVSIHRKTTFQFFSWTGLFLGVYLLAGTSSFSKLIALPVQDRYFEILVPFIGVAVAGVVDQWRKGPRSGLPRNALAYAFPALLVLASVPAVIENAGELVFSGLGRNAAQAIRALDRSVPERPIYVSPSMRLMLRSFLDTATRDRLRQIPVNGPLPRGYYLLHPWQDTPRRYQPASAIDALPVYVGISGDHRVFGHIAAARDREIVVHYRD